jgi:hypothetical protein
MISFVFRARKHVSNDAAEDRSDNDEHDGSEHRLDEVVNFYNQRFRMNLTVKEKTQLIAFLNSL